nr:MAG TPA: hypothetical protein [Caudoviricetes sp.]
MQMGCCHLFIFGILGNTILHWVCAWESIWIAECLEPLDTSRGAPQRRAGIIMRITRL